MSHPYHNAFEQRIILLLSVIICYNFSSRLVFYLLLFCLDYFFFVLFFRFVIHPKNFFKCENTIQEHIKEKNKIEEKTKNNNNKIDGLI